MEDRKFNLLIAMRSYNRPEYLLNTINNLKKADIELCQTFIIYDDHSSDNETISILNNKDLLTFGDNRTMEVIFNNRNYGVFVSYINLLDYVITYYSDHTYILIIDNDIDMKTDFLSLYDSIYQECISEFNTNQIVLSGFKPTNAHLNNEKKYYTNFHTRYSVGAVCYYFSFDFITTIKQGWIENSDFGVSSIIDRTDNNYFCCVNKSLVNHMGVWGTWSHGYCDNDTNFQIE